MPIRFHCHSCSQLMSISRKKAGEAVNCPTCGILTVVPPEAPTDGDPEESIVSNPSPVPVSPMEFAAWDDDAPGAEIEEVEVRAEEVPPAEPVRSAAAPVESEDDVVEFRVRKPQTEFEDMDLTPMVDVTFLLLIFFMLTASFSLQKTIPTPVPEANEQSASQPIQSQDELLEKSILIEIDDGNAIFLDEEPVSDPRQLVSILREKMNRDQKAEVLVDASEEAFNETVVFVLDAANDVGMQKIRMTFPKNSSRNN